MAPTPVTGGFNPDIPKENAPDWYRASQSIPNFNLTSTLGVAAHGAGELFSSAIKGADEIVKAFSKVDAERTFIPEKEQYAATLGAGDAAIRLTRLARAGGPAPTVSQDNKGLEYPGAIDVPSQATSKGPEPTNLLPQGMQEAELPTDLKNLPTNLNTISGARASGKISETDYYARLMALAKDVRSRYPVGYRDWIDEQISKITGVDPANAYIKSVIGDINSYIGAGQDDRKGVLSDLRQLAMRGDQSAAAMHEYVLNGGDLNRAVGYVADRNSFRWKLEQQKATLEGVKNNTELQGTIAKQFFFSNGATYQSQWFEDYETAMMAKGVQRDKDGNWILSSEQAVAEQQVILAKREQFKAFLRQVALRQNLATLHDQKSVNEWIDSLAQPFTDAADRMGNDKSGQIHMAANLTAAIEHDDKLSNYKDKGTGWVWRTSEQIRKTWGEQGAAVWFAQAGIPEFVKNLFDAQKRDVATRDPSNPRTLESIREETERKGAGFPGTFPAFVNHLTGEKGLLSSIPDNAKYPLAASISNPNNRGLLLGIKPGYMDEQKRWHSGREDVWNAITSEPVALEMKRLGQTKGFIWNDYKDTTGTLFREEIFKDDIAKITTFVNSDVTPFKFKWTADKANNVYRFDVVPTKGELPKEQTPQTLKEGYSFLQPNQRTDLQNAQRLVEHLNGGLRGLVNVAKAGGANPEEEILKIFNQSGTDLTKLGDNVPDRMVKAIKAIRDQQEKAKTETERKYKELEK